MIGQTHIWGVSARDFNTLWRDVTDFFQRKFV